MKEKLDLYTLHPSEKDLSIYKCGIVARNPQEAASMLGGEYKEPEGGIKQVASDPEELYFVGFVVFRPELFRDMSYDEMEVAGLFRGRKCYVKWPLTLLAPHGGGSAILAMRKHPVILPEYLVVR